MKTWLKKEYDKPWVLQFNYTDTAHISRCDFEKPGTWYPEIKGDFVTPEEALEKINWTLRISSEKMNDFTYGGRKWRLNNLETGDIISLTITNEQATIST